MNRTNSVVCMLVVVLGLATSEAWAQHSEHGTSRDVTLEQLRPSTFRDRSIARQNRIFR